MAKVFDNLYPQLLEFSNLYAAWQKAAKGKRRSLFAKPVPLRTAGRGRMQYAPTEGGSRRGVLHTPSSAVRKAA
ncbi:hypothetical protein J9253_03870 [Thiothrix litoralis]|uniref:Uncharacterized protein n=1 Tax=Thiothrix litoralis TaxID=2891210 RepID=A0ABX7WU07_9GAMM|nr:hypothetical protein [Thiothrix litoralis]QTR47090.1 hypothetical protein J9253_03870 [Thiothrix litoralis]